MFYCKKWMVNFLIANVLFLQITCQMPKNNKVRVNLSKRRIPLQPNRKVVNQLQQAASTLPILKIQQNTGALPILKVSQPLHHPVVNVPENPVTNHAAPINTNQPVITNNYNYEYSVHDQYTGDIKEHKETRNNDIVEGYYSLIEPNGRKRIVHYNSNNLNGFNAFVRYENVGSVTHSNINNNNVVQNKQIEPLQSNIKQFPQTHVSINTPAFSYKY